MCLKIIIQRLFILSIALFSLSNSHANAFKCVDQTGNIIFQDLACTDDEKESVIKMQKNTSSRLYNSQCLLQCDKKRAVCVAELGGGRRNTGKNVLLCEKAKQACYLTCVNASNAGKIETLTRIERANYERELRREQVLRNKSLYYEKKENRYKKRAQERDQKRCRKYERKLAKAKARWTKVQEQAKGWTPPEEAYHRRRIENAEDTAIIECK